LGGNQGNIIETFRSVIAKLTEKLGSVTESSGYYESEPWGFESEQNFINQVVEIDCSIPATDVLKTTQSVEQEFGRVKKSGTGYSSRPIDIDILFFDNLIIDSSNLTIPHPRLHERMFTLLPLSEKWAEFMHPVKNRTIQQLQEECVDKGWAKIIQS
jgi:2-amino-4-hydroxy-6-hydroxymethyldihydropteridine diphosphokinase